MKTKLKILPMLVIFAFLTACATEGLYQDLSERDANEILVVLFKNGIDADKVRVEGNQEVTYTIAVEKDEIQKARSILVANNLPKQRELGFSGICQEKGLIPTPEEEKCRKLLALKGEIINSLERVPGVIDADVVLNIPEINEFDTETGPKKRPTASAVLRVKKDLADVEVREVNMQRFISNAVEDLDPRDVAVIISYVDPPEKVIAQGPQGPATTGAEGGVAPVPTGPLATIAGLVLHQESLKRFKLYAVIFLILLIGVSSALILNVIRLTKIRQELKVARAHGGAGEMATPLLEEGSQGKSPQLQSGEGEKVETPPQV